MQVIHTELYIRNISKILCITSESERGTPLPDPDEIAVVPNGSVVCTKRPLRIQTG